MERSEQIGELISSLAMAQLEFEAATKDSKNPYYNSSYADLASVLRAIRPALNRQGIALINMLYSDLEQQTASASISLHKAEQWISFTFESIAVGKSKDGKDRFDIQTLGACWTYLRRYGVQAICSLAGEDDDGNALIRDDAMVVVKKQTKESAPQNVIAGARTRFFSDAMKEGKTSDDIKNVLVALFGAPSTENLSQEQLDQALKAMREKRQQPELQPSPEPEGA